MAHYQTVESYSPVERLLAQMGHLLERAAARLAHYRVYSSSLNELRALSDRDLNDLGLNRCSLRQVARDAANKKVPLH